MKKLTVVLVALCLALAIMLPLAALAAETGGLVINGISYVPKLDASNVGPKGKTGYQALVEIGHEWPVGSGASKSEAWRDTVLAKLSLALQKEGGIPKTNIAFMIRGARGDNAYGETQDDIGIGVGPERQPLPHTEEAGMYYLISARALFFARQMQFSEDNGKVGVKETQTSVIASGEWTLYKSVGMPYDIDEFGRDMYIFISKRLAEVHVEGAIPLSGQEADYSAWAKVYPYPHSTPLGFVFKAFYEHRGYDGSAFAGGGIGVANKQDKGEFMLDIGNHSGSKFGTLADGPEARITFTVRM